MKTVSRWFRLDNAAKIFPPTSSKRDPKVFRIACELKKNVDPRILQNALDRTIQQFPFYRSVLKKGLFWYYFEDSQLKPRVTAEQKPPCRPIYDADARTLLFEVTYFRKRINLEVFHALSDGTGAVHFFRTLLLYYLKETTGKLKTETFDLEDYDASPEQKGSDAFSKYYEKQKNKKKDKHIRAFKIRGERLPDYRLGVIEGRMSLKAVLAKAKAAGASLTEFLTAILIFSIHDGMSLRERKRPVVITVPVDLRKYFSTSSARNFFSIIKADHNFTTQGQEFEDILKSVKENFARQLAPEEVQQKLNRLSGLEHNTAVKLVPLFIKRPFLQIANWQAEREESSALSNVGIIRMPPEIAESIKLFCVFNSTKRPQANVCSYGDMLDICFSSPLLSSAIQKNFFRKLTGMGVSVEIVSNTVRTSEGGG